MNCYVERDVPAELSPVAGVAVTVPADRIDVDAALRDPVVETCQDALFGHGVSGDQNSVVPRMTLREIWAAFASDYGRRDLRVMAAVVARVAPGNAN